MCESVRTIPHRALTDGDAAAQLHQRCQLKEDAKFQREMLKRQRSMDKEQREYRALTAKPAASLHDGSMGFLRLLD